MIKEATCISGKDFSKDWDQWRRLVSETIKSARKIGMEDKLMELASVKVGDFLSERLCAASKEEALIKDLWKLASPEERKVLARLLFKLMDESTKEYTEEELSEPFAGWTPPL